MNKKLLQEEYKQALKQLKQAQDAYRRIKKKIDSESYEEAVENYKKKAFCFNNESYYLVTEVIQSENVIYFQGTSIHFQITDKDQKNFQIEYNTTISQHTLKEAKKISLKEYEKIVVQTTNTVKAELINLQ